jgi:manganese efflux pump family protein
MEVTAEIHEGQGGHSGRRASTSGARTGWKPQERCLVIAPTVIALILPLALDTFAVSAAVGVTNPTRRQRLRLSSVFALFDGGTPAIGVLMGGPLGQVLGATADFLAIAILIGFGAYTLFRKEREDEEGASKLASAHGPALILIGLSVSLDELAIGFTLGLLGAPVLPILVAIGVQTFTVSQLGFWLGASLSRRFREVAERIAGTGLIALGAILLAERLF